MLSVKGFFSVASIASLLPFVPVCLSSVSDPCLYPSCLCLPLRTSFSRCPPYSRREGAAASSVLSLGAFIVLEVNNNYAAATIYRYLGPWQCKLTIYFQENFPKWNYAVQDSDKYYYTEYLICRGILANYFKKLSLYFALSLPFWYGYLNNKSGQFERLVILYLYVSIISFNCRQCSS